MTRPNNDMLDDLFAQARADTPGPSDDLMARVLADADAVQDGFAAPIPAPEQKGLWARMVETVGGWPAVSGLAAATVAGVWIGVAPPASITEVTASLLGEEYAVPLVPGDLGFDAGVFADG